MSEGEMLRPAVLAQVKSKAWTLVEASERMEWSCRQTKRRWKRYQGKGRRHWCTATHRDSRSAGSRMIR